ncbi:hypothetical protein EON63_04060 [archaeon]|nr:MAG: hypothetical protein EON63_04060 [archaeon]
MTQRDNHYSPPEKSRPFEDYDEYFWSNQGPWIAGFPGEGVRRPDLLTVQFGMHSCWHASPHGAKSANYHLTHFNQSMFDLHVKNIWKLMAAMRSALDHDPPIAGASRNHTTIIFLTSGSIGMEEVGDETDKCILKMNRVTAEAARAYGFAVLDRGEIERRLVFKSFLSNHKHIPIETHLAQPAQNIVATSLLHLYDCLEDAKASRSREPGDTVVQYPVVVNKGSNAMSQPLYSPP